MIKMKNIIKTFCFIILSFFLFSPNVFADGSASTSFSGNSSVYINNNIDVVLSINTNTPIVAIQGEITYDTSKLELVGQTSLAPFDIKVNNTKIAGMDLTGNISITGSRQLIRLTFKAKALGSATISFSGSRQVGKDNVVVLTSGCSKSINITNPPSSNNNLSSLSVSGASINFDKNNTNYNVTVEANVTNVTISATAEDPGARVSGTGSKTLNYGANTFNIVVTAPSGAEKTYTVTVNRKDNRSGNNNLSSLKVNGGTLNPGFNKNTTRYTLSVPFSISSLSIDAIPEDSKAKVSISGNNLVAEETRDVTITVTAENGSTKTYVISVTRGKDPNKVLSNNNYLRYLDISIGILSPVFNKENINYEVWLPYEVATINFDYDVEDTRYATVVFKGDKNLQPGIANIFTITVTAENNEQRVYTISVRRAQNPLVTSEGNTYLKDVKLKNGSLTSSFDKEKHKYNYTRKADFEIEEVIAEDENSAIKIVEDGTTIHIIVISSTGEYGVYTLEEQQFSIISYLIYLLIFIIGCVVGFVIKTLLKSNKKSELDIKLESDTNLPKKKNNKSK